MIMCTMASFSSLPDTEAWERQRCGVPIRRPTRLKMCFARANPQRAAWHESVLAGIDRGSGEWVGTVLDETRVE